MSNSTLSDPLNWTAAILMTFNAVLGIIFNGIVVHNFITTSSERTSFNVICFFRGAVNCIILGVGFLTLFVPMTILGDSLFSPVYQSIVICIVLGFYTGLQNSGFLIAINRFCAMFFMLIYSKYFTTKVTFAFTSVVFLYRIFKMTQDISKFTAIHCYSTYSAEYLTWFPPMTENCSFKFEGVVDGSAIILGALVIINVVTFIKIYFFYKANALESKEIKRRMRKNRVLFIQTILQDFAYLIDVLFTFKLGNLISARYWSFISGTLIWECVHTSDGLIMIIFNEKLSFFKMKIFSAASPATSIVVHSQGEVMSRHSQPPVN